MNLSTSPLAQIALLLHFLLLFTLGFAWRSWVIYRRTGINPIVLPTSDDAAGYVARGFRLCMLALLGYTLLPVLWPASLAWSGPSLLLQRPVLFMAGWACLLLALLLMGKAQHDLGLSWRIGVDEAATPQLVETGLYARSRNPIFLALRLGLLGLVLVSPSSLSLLLAGVGECLMQVQVRLEEAYLARSLGERYASYSTRVPRWL